MQHKRLVELLGQLKETSQTYNSFFENSGLTESFLFRLLENELIRSSLSLDSSIDPQHSTNVSFSHMSGLVYDIRHDHPMIDTLRHLDEFQSFGDLREMEPLMMYNVLFVIDTRISSSKRKFDKSPYRCVLFPCRSEPEIFTKHIHKASELHEREIVLGSGSLCIFGDYIMFDPCSSLNRGLLSHLRNQMRTCYPHIQSIIDEFTTAMFQSVSKAGRKRLSRSFTNSLFSECMFRTIMQQIIEQANDTNDTRNIFTKHTTFMFLNSFSPIRKVCDLSSQINDLLYSDPRNKPSEVFPDETPLLPFLRCMHPEELLVPNYKCDEWLY